MALFAIALGNGTCLGLEISAYGLFGVAQKILWFGRLDFVEMARKRHRLPVEKIAAASDAVEGDLVSAENQAGETVSRICHQRHISPGVGRVARMDAD